MSIIELKKTNAFLTLAVSLAIILHIVTVCFVILSKDPSALPMMIRIGKIASRIFVLHVFLSLLIAFLFSGCDVSKYSFQKKELILQRGAALLLICFYHFHNSALMSVRAPVLKDSCKMR